MKMIKVECCLASEGEKVCEYGYWKIDSRNKRLLAVCGEEEKNIRIFEAPELTPDRVEIPEWCPLEDVEAL